MTETTTTTATADVTEPRPRWGIIIAGVFLIFVLIGAVVMWINNDDEPDATATTPGSSQPISGDSRQTVTDRLGRVVFMPDNPAGDVLPKTDSTTDELDVQWQRLSGRTQITIARDYPFSATAGPWEVTDGIAHGFARSAEGAALAGIHAFLGIGQGGQQASRASLRFLSDPAAKEAPQYMLDNPDGVQSPEAPWTTTFAAYTVLSYDDDNALIRYASPSGDGYQQLDASLVWQDGDWKLTPGVPFSKTSAVAESEVQTWEQL